MSARSTFSDRASRCGLQIERDQLTSMILWGPPGVGKTTLARLIAQLTRCEFVPFSAVLSGIKEIKAVMADAERNRAAGPPHHGVRRRDPPLQQGAAGCVSAVRRAGRHHPDRRHHRESVVRSDLGAAVAIARFMRCAPLTVPEIVTLLAAR